MSPMKQEVSSKERFERREISRQAVELEEKARRKLKLSCGRSLAL